MACEFLKDETGAVTVDWVVMTAALVGLGLATMSVVSNGVEDTSRDIAGTMNGSSIIRTSFLRAVTGGFVADGVFAVGSDFSELRNATAYSFRMDATLNAGDSGILYEAGGNVHGTILYQHDGVLYLQAGNGGSYGAAANRGEAVWTVEDGDYTIEGSLDASSGLALYVNGEMVSQSSFSHPYLSGGNNGTVGDSNSSTARNRGGFMRGDGHPGAGELTVFMDETTGDVSGG